MRLATAFPLVVLAACASSTSVSNSERRAIADSLTRQVKAAYDLSKPDVEQRLLSLYPESGRVVSAAGGQIIGSRDTLALGIKAFWQNVGSNMRQPQWVWDQMLFDVLSPNAAVMTATYHVPHLTPRNQPHTIGGAWTAVFQKRGDRWYIIQEHLSDLPPVPDSAVAPMPPGMKMPAGTSTPPGGKPPE
jgi:ketosteroid isomerase-like protein